MSSVRYLCLAAGALIIATGATPNDRSSSPKTADLYPFSTELTLLERDLTSGDYRAVLATMIPTDLEAEWQRIATSDNYLAFSEQHGGRDKVLADPALRAAYEKRKQIADSF